jgi:tetratricopeptide (TPR) repeat protein
MEEGNDFTTTLRAFMLRARHGNNDLAELTGISISTIEKWTSGVVQRTRYPHDLLKVAQALRLDAQETSTLLIAAGHPPVEQLQRNASDAELVRLLAPESAAPVVEAGSEQQLSALAPRYQLRPPIADFVGRAQEVERLVAGLRAAVGEGRGAVISGVQGMGGIGKTELAYMVAHQLRDLFPDAQLLLALRGMSTMPLSAEQALQTIIRAFLPDERLPEDCDALAARYQAVLGGRRVLILADDAREAAQVRRLLPPLGCALLITSRGRFTLPGMTSIDLEQLTEAEAVTLLRRTCERLSVAEAEALARACGCLPLALRVSSSLLKTNPALSVRVYLERLMDERQRLVQLCDPDDEQLDVEASLALSYTQLDTATQAVFRQLGVLVADFDTSLAQAMVAAPEGVDVETTLHQLLRHNLVMYEAERARWRLHDLVRDLARRYLETAGEADAAWWRYAHAAVQMAKEMRAQYEAGGEGALAALSRFDAERAHIDAGRGWATEQAGMVEGDRLLVDDATATAHISKLRYDAWRERVPQWERTLAATKRLGDLYAEGLALNNLGGTYTEQGEGRRAIPYYEQALTIAHALGDRRREGIVLGNLGLAYEKLGMTQRAIHYYEQALTIAHEIGDRHGQGWVLTCLGCSYEDLDKPQRAIRYLKQALTIAHEIGDRRGEGQVTVSLGFLYTKLGDPQRAMESCAVALSIAREQGDRRTESYALSYLAHAQTIQGNFLEASTTFEQAVTLFKEIGDRSGEAECNWLFGLALAQHGEYERALSLLRPAVAYEQEIGHTKAEEHMALLARLEAGEELPPELHLPPTQRAIRGDSDKPTEDEAQP